MASEGIAIIFNEDMRARDRADTLNTVLSMQGVTDIQEWPQAGDRASRRYRVDVQPSDAFRAVIAMRSIPGIDLAHLIEREVFFSLRLPQKIDTIDLMNDVFNNKGVASMQRQAPTPGCVNFRLHLNQSADVEPVMAALLKIEGILPESIKVGNLVHAGHNTNDGLKVITIDEILKSLPKVQ